MGLRVGCFPLDKAPGMKVLFYAFLFTLGVDIVTYVSPAVYASIIFASILITYAEFREFNSPCPFRPIRQDERDRAEISRPLDGGRTPGD